MGRNKEGMATSPKRRHLTESAMTIRPHRFDLILNLVRRNFLLQFKGSLLGLLWAVLLPLSQLMIFVFLFKRVVPLKIENYPAFVFTGLLPWNWFSMSIISASSLFISNRDLVRRPNFEPSILALVNALSNLLTYLISLPIIFILLATSGKRLTWAVLLLPLIMLIQGTLIVGLSLFLATWNVFYRDLQHITGVAVMLMFYLTPVFYSLENVGREYRRLFTLNPMAVLIQSYRAILYEGTVPDASTLLVATTVSVTICGLGYLAYRRDIQNVYDFL
jgi:ABC-type polysaccharide/polyol phosphate export permease